MSASQVHSQYSHNMQIGSHYEVNDMIADDDRGKCVHVPLLCAGNSLETCIECKGKESSLECKSGNPECPVITWDSEGRAGIEARNGFIGSWTKCDR